MKSSLHERVQHVVSKQETFMTLLSERATNPEVNHASTADEAIVSQHEIGLSVSVQSLLNGQSTHSYLFVEGNAVESLQLLPAASVDTVITSPPYWKQREYANPNCIGAEPTLTGYIDSLLAVFSGVYRVLKPTGSFWLNIGDTYRDKGLCSVPWRVAIALQDNQGWILRNDVVWNKVKGAPDNSKDKLRNVHEFMFHFVKQKKYYYDDTAVRNHPRLPTVQNGKVVTATGVSGINYKRQIQRSTALSDEEKAAALRVLDDTLCKVALGELHDFRMIIRGQQRTTHSDSTKVSGRASEIARKGFCILPYDKQGTKIDDVWEIIPEDEWRTDSHCAPFPEELCAIPIEASCPPGGVVLDPFSGTGTAILSAIRRRRKGIGLEISREYLETAVVRLEASCSVFDLLV